jgi:hypothetical protein
MKLFKSLPTHWELLFVLLGLILDRFALGGLLPILLKLLGYPGNLFLIALSDFAFSRVGNGGEKITGSLSCGALSSHVDEVLFGFVTRSEVNLSSLIQYNSFVELVVNCL